MPAQSMGSLAEQASKLLDFSQKLDINLLDNVVDCLYKGEGLEVGYFLLLPLVKFSLSLL